MSEPTELEAAYLRMYGPDTYGIGLPPSLAHKMERKGWIEWMPPKFGTQLWAITEAGRKVAQSLPMPNKRSA